MTKIKDRIVLGAIAGLGANIVKSSIGFITMKMNLAELDGPHRAFSMAKYL